MGGTRSSGGAGAGVAGAPPSPPGGQTTPEGLRLGQLAHRGIDGTDAQYRTVTSLVGGRYIEDERRNYITASGTIEDIAARSGLKFEPHYLPQIGSAPARQSYKAYAEVGRNRAPVIVWANPSDGVVYLGVKSATKQRQREVYDRDEDWGTF